MLLSIFFILSIKVQNTRQNEMFMCTKNHEISKSYCFEFHIHRNVFLPTTNGNCANVYNKLKTQLLQYQKFFAMHKILTVQKYHIYSNVTSASQLPSKSVTSLATYKSQSCVVARLKFRLCLYFLTTCSNILIIHSKTNSCDTSCRQGSLPLSDSWP